MDRSINSAKKRKRVEKEQSEKLSKAGPVIGTSNSGVKKVKNSSKPPTKPPEKSQRTQPRPKQQTKGQGELGSDIDEDEDVQGSGDEDDTPTQDSKVFTDLKLSTEILNSISSMGLTELTSIQRKTMPLLLAGKDVIALSKPGSGKTLAALVSIISLVISRNVKPRNGTIAIVLTPTRESALRLLGVASELLSNAPQTLGITTDGSNIRPEVERLANGVNILIATPRRLLEHLNTTPAFVIRNLENLVIDDAERIAKMSGIEDILAHINKVLPKKRSTALFSAETIDETVVETLHLRSPHRVQADDQTEQQPEPVKGQVQGYVLIEPEKRFLLLHSFLKKFSRKKIIVVFSSTSAARSYADLLSTLELEVNQVHGKQTTQQRASNYSRFKGVKEGVLVCTDAMFRGHEIPAVDWIIQYDPPEDPLEFISCLGRSAGSRSVIFLLPDEQAFIEYLKEAEVETEEFEFSSKQLVNIQNQLEKLVSKDYQLHCLAKDAFRSYLKNYTVHTLPSIFDYSKLDVANAAKSFGFDTPPRVDVHFGEAKYKNKGRMSYAPPKPGAFPGKVIKRKATAV
ncbi:P-loop containing nucleoside triphosphate hydrolase protein [Choiromyces venosus 120613-1]|uniref:ATP-dependent RNA helicase n=1 Tax=Choiromyces venosus 120613-1 TaxID=1336337 RepID=A0A3N4JR26_9PEZI|nr:P-loop containing nucleoside triphosphate hydrolase protein [Choiromyces venosus 120613-1]